MYTTLLSLHSVFRWLIVIGVIYTLYRAYTGLAANKTFTSADANTRKYTVIAAHIQLLLGLALYFLSPMVQYFMSNFSAAVKIKEMRFYGMEHSIVMILAIILITIGSAVSKKKESDRAKIQSPGNMVYYCADPAAVNGSLACFTFFYAALAKILKIQD